MTDTHRLQAIIVTADTPNLNNRVYPKAVLEKAIATYLEHPVKLGCLGMKEDCVISLVDVSHEVENLEFSDNDVRATIKVLSTPKGIELNELIAKGGIEFRLAGIGSVEKENDNYVVQDDYKIISVNALLKEDAA